MPDTPFTKGLHDLGRGCFAWLQPDGGWGWSNAGLVTDSGESLLVDTLFDLRLTAEMLAAMRKQVPAAARIATLVNTHANGDHCYGNQLVAGARIVASRASAEEMDELPPAAMARVIENAAALGPAGEYFKRVFAPFDFRGIAYTPPTETFDGELRLRVGAKEVVLFEVGPAHTRGDILVWVPEDRVVFTGDILFIGGTPIIWQGPVSNWIAACEKIAALDAAVVVPGHGPLTDAKGALAVRDYLVHIRDRARECFDAGLAPADAARALPLGPFARWGEAERIAVNVHALYREWSGGKQGAANPIALFGLMGELERAGARVGG
ncbi:MAG TPA: MBL fold metallo-hydrolase [Myxococcota bacterium]|nr:MBL fold metallo-hydrolase [Myxococcota bacterium]